MPLASPPQRGARTVEVVNTEEKGSDVNLAAYLLLDAFQRDCKVAVVISNDSHLKLPIEIAQTDLVIRVGVVNPHPPAHRSRALQPTFFKQLRTSALGACQFPSVLTDTKGACHAGGRGFESRRSRSTTSLQTSMLSCLLRRDEPSLKGSFAAPAHASAEATD
jgi:hypothetical protein